MTIAERVRRLRGPIVSAVSTAGLLIIVLGIQRARGAWPFPAAPGVTAVASSAETPMDMPLPAEEMAVADRVPIEVSAATQQELGVRVEAVRRESLTRTLQAAAIIVPDESRLAHVHTRVAGWIEQLDVNTTGEVVQAGQPLARLFSQELLSSQADYLAIRSAVASSGISSAAVTGGRSRLTVLGMTDAEIDEIERTGVPRRLVTIIAPRSGVVLERGVTAGTAVDPSTTLLTIADLTSVWVFAEVPEDGIAGLRVGAAARLEFPASGRPPFTARVDFLYPTLTERTRTLRVRFSVANPRSALRPGLYGTAAFDVQGAMTITVPRDAVIDRGREQHVFVVSGGRLEPRRVTLGARLADRVEVLSGLADGERIVAAGVFLLDSESRLRATGGMGGHGHATSSTDSTTPSAKKRPPPDTVSHADHRE